MRSQRAQRLSGWFGAGLRVLPTAALEFAYTVTDGTGQCANDCGGQHRTRVPMPPPCPCSYDVLVEPQRTERGTMRFNLLRRCGLPAEGPVPARFDGMRQGLACLAADSPSLLLLLSMTHRHL